MRHQDQQSHADHPEVIKSDPVPVTTPDRDQSARTDEPDQVNGSDRIEGAPIGEHDARDRNATDQNGRDQNARDQNGRDQNARDRNVTDQNGRDQHGRDRDSAYRDGGGRERPEFHEPAPVPTTFGATTVGGSAAAAALANPDRALEPDPREESTVRSGDGWAEDRIDGVNDDRTERMPGGVPAEPVAAFLTDDAVRGLRDRWRDVQLRFIDDPQAAVGEAQGLVEETVESLATALAAKKDDLAGWRNDKSGDTEQLRVAARRYRDFLDRLLGL